MSFCTQGLPGVAESTFSKSEGKPSPLGRGVRQGGWGVWESVFVWPSLTVYYGFPSTWGRGEFVGWWILRLRLRLRAEWQGGRHTAKSDSFRTKKINRKEIWWRVDLLSWCCVHQFWIDPVPIVFGMMLWELVLEWSFSYWLLIDVCIGFGLMLCKLVLIDLCLSERTKSVHFWSL